MTRPNPFSPQTGALLFQSAFQQSPNAYVLLDTTLLIVECNKAYELKVGIPRSRLIGQPFFSVFPTPAQEHNALRVSMLRAIDERVADTLPLLRYPITPGGYPDTWLEPSALVDRYWTVVTIPLLDSEGNTRFLLNHPTDITDLTLLHDTEPANAATAQHENKNAQFLTLEELQELANAKGSTLIKMQNLLLAERQRMHDLFQHAPGFICILRGSSHIFEIANDAYYQLVGHREIIGHEVAKALPEVVEQGFLDKLNKVFASGEPFIGRAVPILLQRNKTDPLTQCYIDLIYQPIRNAHGQVTGIFVQGHDVTDAYLVAKEVSYQAAHDPLTGLFNRREFARLIEMLATPAHSLSADEAPAISGKPHALLYLDLDQFKIVNDRCGHAAGDELLRQVAKLLSDHVRETDILARMGGDEFALVLRHCNADHALQRAECLRKAVSNLVFFWNGQRYGVSLSVGLVAFDNQVSASFNKALSMADAACFLAKEKGRNRVQVYHPNNTELVQQQRDMDWATRLQDCLAQDRVQLFGQRIYALEPDSDKTIDRYEILARLVDTDGSLVHPGIFIPAAERFGLMPALDLHIIQKAFQALNDLPEQHRKNTKYFVNISGFTLGEDTLLEKIEQIIDTLPDFDPRQVCFEITETAALSNLTASQAAMKRLIALGFKFALDDFGSGVSSFSYLRKLPVHYIKIDGEFITHIEHDPVSKVMVEAMANVARTMEIATIGEFVESQAIAELLAELGIDYGQGFGLHQPVPLTELTPRASDR